MSTRKNLISALAAKGVTKGLSKLAKPNLERLLRGNKNVPNASNLTKLTRHQLGLVAKNRGIKVLSKNTKKTILNKLAAPPVPTSVIVEQKKSSVDCITRSKIPLHDYQKKVCQMLNKQRGVIAVHSVGTGKTLTAVTASQCFLQKHPLAKVIVVTPVSLIDNFKKEMIAYGISNKDPQYVFYSHAKFILEYQNGKIKPQDLRGNMIIIDEIHNFKNTRQHHPQPYTYPHQQQHFQYQEHHNAYRRPHEQDNQHQHQHQRHHHQQHPVH